ncbi:TPA: hypothetical protein ACH93O_001700 [Staphylococcus aureus]|nr:hypothetical protein QP65_11595 [Staphylococcus aureus]MBM0835129.1 nitrogen fixation protein NifR [Staphylococcus aureus]MBS3356116.1 hypothetical protein [Staphylococcus aureus]HCT1640070.1 hypothetical protein [Staphylococcus aureus]HCZ8366394.1 hypothetical protein [Staphylococcus aureus]
MPDLIEMIVFNVFTNRRGPNIEGDEKSAYNNVQVGERGPNTEGDEKSAYNNVQVGERGPT